MSEDSSVTSFWDSPNVASVEAESSGGNGWISHVKIAFGYKVFVSGASNEESFFEFDVSNPKSRDDARKDASAFAKSHMAKGNPAASIAVILRKDETYLYDTSRWKGDRWWVLPTYTESWEKVLKPSLRETGIQLGDSWARVGLKPDPFKPLRKSIDQLTGEEKEVANLVPYIMEVFKDKDDAVLAASKETSVDAPAQQTPSGVVPKTTATQPSLTGDGVGDGEYPDGWGKESWSFVLSDMKSMAAKGMTAPAIAKEFDVPVRYVVKALQG